MLEQSRGLEGFVSVEKPAELSGVPAFVKTLEEHPEIKNNLNLAPEIASVLIPDILKQNKNFELRLGRFNNSSSSEMVVVDKKVPYKGSVSLGEMRFGESVSVDNFFKDGERKRAPLFYVQLDTLNDNRRALILSTIDINKIYQGKGIGTEFKQRLEIFAREMGFELIIAEAFDSGVESFFRKGDGFKVLRDGEILAMMERQGLRSKTDGYRPIVKNLN